MKHLKRLPAVLIPIALVVLGLAAVLAGLYLLLGLEPTLIAGGVLAVVAGLVVDV